MERIKINQNFYDLVSDGVRLTEQGGQIIFRPGETGFNVIKGELEASREITVVDGLDNPILSRSDLVYAGRLTLDAHYPLGTEQAETGVDEAGDPIYETRDITGPVMIAEFRTPDLRDQVAALEAQLAYVAMMANVDVEEV